jgi:3',5'-cyclic AMP phosphodiesterase CpdA
VHFAAVLLGLLAALLPAAGQAQGREILPDRIVAFGDFGVGGSTQRAFGEAVRRFEARNHADLLVTLGDNDYTENPAAFWTNWQESFGWTQAAGLRIAGVLGNHDVRVDGGRYQFETLGMAGRFYRLRRRNVELFLLDSTRVDRAQTAWLARVLRRSKAPWKVAVVHHPAFTCGSYRSHPAVVRNWVPLFERHGVRLVLSGHDHNYQRFAPRRGVRYVVHGGGGAGAYEPQACPSGYPRRLRAWKEHGFVYLVARANRLDGWTVTTAGRRTDHFTFSAGG